MGHVPYGWVCIVWIRRDRCELGRRVYACGAPPEFRNIDSPDGVGQRPDEGRPISDTQVGVSERGGAGNHTTWKNMMSSIELGLNRTGLLH